MLLRVFVNVEKITFQLSLLTLPEGPRRNGRRYYLRFSLLSAFQMHFAFIDQFGINDFITDFTRISFLHVFTDGGCEKFHPADTQMMPMAVVQEGREEMLTMTLNCKFLKFYQSLLISIQKLRHQGPKSKPVVKFSICKKISLTNIEIM